MAQVSTAFSTGMSGVQESARAPLADAQLGPRLPVHHRAGWQWRPLPWPDIAAADAVTPPQVPATPVIMKANLADLGLGLAKK